MEKIEKYYYSVDKPIPIQKDSRGVMLDTGLSVAYNYSGTVAIGKIIAINKNEFVPRDDNRRVGLDTIDWVLKFEIEIQHEDGNISKIKNPNSFIII